MGSRLTRLLGSLFLTTAIAAGQLPPRLEKCLPIPSYGSELKAYQQDIGTNSPKARVQLSVDDRTLTPEGRKALEKTIANERFDLEDWKNQVQERVRFNFLKLGYFKVEVELTGPSDGVFESPINVQWVTAKAIVREGPLYRLGEITFERQTVFTEPQLRSLFLIESGQIFNAERITLGLEALRKAYGEKGYINFTPIPDTVIDEVNKTISLSVTVDEGPVYKVAEIKALGLDQIAVSNILKAVDMPPGTVFSSARLEEAILRFSGSLPKGWDYETDSSVTRDDKNHTVSIALDFRECPGEKPRKR